MQYALRLWLEPDENGLTMLEPVSGGQQGAVQLRENLQSPQQQEIPQAIT